MSDQLPLSHNPKQQSEHAYNDESLLILLYIRSLGRSRNRAVYHRIKQHYRSSIRLQETNQICAPHSKAISSLNMDKIEDRFLVAGSADATISIYDLSKWGRDNNTQQHRHLYRPIAQSLKSQAGHTSSIVRAEWYPFDTGAFVSASTDSKICVWDTQTMQTVVQWQPFESSSLSSMHLSRSEGRSSSLLAIGSYDDAMVKLVDIRSGAASHSLVGHVRGISCLQWASVSDVVLASGSLDGTVRLWDIRHGGSRACITALDRDVHSAYPLIPYQPDYRHLRKGMKRKSSGPNTYYHQAHVVSHNGAVTAVSFTDDGRHLLSCGGKNNQVLQLWDFTSQGHLVTRQFAGPAISPPMHVVDAVVWMAACSKLCAYAMDQGGAPMETLEGHLGRVTALESSSWNLFSGGADGMILVWGPR